MIKLTEKIILILKCFIPNSKSVKVKIIDRVSSFIYSVCVLFIYKEGAI
jgi:hypothetical protein